MLYFAYGSNMDPAQMRQRCPGSEAIGIGVLRGYALCFPRRSYTRGCGVASIEPAAEQEVWGVVYRLAAADLASLDSFEGYRADGPVHENRYNRVAITVEVDAVPTDVETYIAISQENPPPPNEAYLAQLRAGATHHRLPDEYRAFLAGLA